MNKCHDIKNIPFEGEFFEVTIDGMARKFELDKVSPLLQQASDTERKTFEVSPSGYGIHWPLLDEDISIDALLGIVSESARNRKTA